jgi:CRISPR-associated protein (TIGR03986 family)
MAVTAPFQFARIPRAVWFPDWGKWVSHDVPFVDGYSGTIDIEIEAMTPLLIGGERRKAAETQVGEVWPVQLPDGTYAIPGSSLQGMIRNILEIACFGKLGPWVEQRRFGIRELTPASKPFYQDRMLQSTGHNPINVQPLVKAGWLRKNAGQFEFKACELARIEFSELAAIAGNTQNQWTSRSDIKARYDTLGAANVRQSLFVEDASCNPVHSHRNNSLSIAYAKASRAEKHNTNRRTGAIIMSGNTGVKTPAKHMEFFFFDDKPTINLSTDFSARFEEFLEIHEPNDGRPKNPNWSNYRDNGYPGEKPFRDGGWMPIFYLGNTEKIESFGLAYMFKLAHLHDTHTMLAHSSSQHSDKSGYDFPSLIFGGIGDSGESTMFSYSLKRRASFDWAIAEPTVKSIEALYNAEYNNVEQDNRSSPPTPPANATVLLGPKPSYFPIYVRQPARKDNRLTRGNNDKVNEPFATYTPIKGADATKSAPELSGVKIWPVSGKSLFFDLPRAPVKSGTDSSRSASSKATQVHLHALPEKTKFITQLHIHNLRASELGALLWALTFQDERALAGEFGKSRHRIGMGKPYGMGEIRMRIQNVNLTANQGDVQPNIVADCVASFETKMNFACLQMAKDSKQRWMKGSNAAPVQAGIWRKTAQVEALLKAANVGGGALHSYMKLEDFIQGKLDGCFLTPYAGHGFELERKSQDGAPVLGRAAHQGGFAFVEDAPIQRKRDDARGFLRKKLNNGAWLASFNSGVPETIYPEDVIVTDHPDE